MPKINELSPTQLEKFTLDLFETLLETFPKFDEKSQRMLAEQANKYAEKLNGMAAPEDKPEKITITGDVTFPKGFTVAKWTDDADKIDAAVKDAWRLVFLDDLPLEEKQFFKPLDILIKTFRHASIEERKVIGSRTYKFTMKLLNELTDAKKTAEE